MSTPDPGTARHRQDALDHRARARSVRPRLVRAADNPRRSSHLIDVGAESAVVLVEAGALARAAELAATAGALPPGLSGRAALGWQAATEAIVTALRRAADHRGGRVPEPDPEDVPGPVLDGWLPPTAVDWSRDSGSIPAPAPGAEAARAAPASARSGRRSRRPRPRRRRGAGMKPRPGPLEDLVTTADRIASAATPVADALAALGEFSTYVPPSDVLISYTRTGCIVRVADRRAAHRETIEKTFSAAFLAAGWEVTHRRTGGLGMAHPSTLTRLSLP
ncbi:hypothetical protein [Streptomyces sp. NPDC096068]|uniref:hypothetical protein n=1 Tax=Streptomyces sp. NPDC096068 TaxID=3155424 RepID=UPI0033334F38